MKELSIEQKAKAYDEALEKSKRLYEQGTITESLAYIFPELKESEDEKTRKALISFLKSPFVNENITDEKVTPWIAWLEKQGGQKPAWSEEDEKVFRALSNALARISSNTRTDSTSINYSLYREIDWLKSIKQRMGG